MSQETKLAVLQSLLSRVQARARSPHRGDAGAPSETNGTAAPEAGSGEETVSAAASTRRSSVELAARPAAPEATVAVAEPSDALDEGSTPMLTHGDLISETVDIDDEEDLGHGDRSRGAMLAGHHAAPAPPGQAPTARDEVPPSAPRVRLEEALLERGAAEPSDVRDERPMTAPPASGRQVASAPRDGSVSADDVLDEMDITIDIPEPGERAPGAPRLPLDSIDLTSPDVAESGPPPAAAARAEPPAPEPPAPEPAAAASARPSEAQPTAPSVVLAPANVEPQFDVRDLSWPPIGQTVPPPPADARDPAPFARHAKSQPRLEVVDEPPSTGRVAPLSHLVDPFPPPPGHSSVPPARRSDAPASDAPPTKWSEPPPPPAAGAVSTSVGALVARAPSVRLQVPSQEPEHAPVEVWASTYAPNLATREVATFVGATTTFAPATFGELLDASLALGG